MKLQKEKAFVESQGIPFDKRYHGAKYRIKQQDPQLTDSEVVLAAIAVLKRLVNEPLENEVLSRVLREHQLKHGG